MPNPAERDRHDSSRLFFLCENELSHTHFRRDNTFIIEINRARKPRPYDFIHNKKPASAIGRTWNYQISSTLYPMLFALCSMPYALCAMLYALCAMLLQQIFNILNREQPALRNHFSVNFQTRVAVDAHFR